MTATPHHLISSRLKFHEEIIIILLTSSALAKYPTRGGMWAQQERKVKQLPFTLVYSLCPTEGNHMNLKTLILNGFLVSFCCILQYGIFRCSKGVCASSEPISRNDTSLFLPSARKMQWTFTVTRHLQRVC